MYKEYMMKRRMILMGLGMAAATVITGCGGSGDTAPLSYTGTVTPGDFVHFTRTGNTISYEVEGDVFGKVTGEVEVTDMTGDGYVFKGTVNGEETYFFTTGNIGMAAIPIEGETYLGVGLKEAKTDLTTDDVTGSYAYGEIEFNPDTHKPVDADGCQIDVAAAGTAEIDCVSGHQETGGWVIAEDKTYLLYKADTEADAITEANADARVVVRPAKEGEPKSFLVDIAGGKGFGMGLERITMTQESVKGNYLAVNYLDRKLLDVTVTPDESDPERLTYTTQPAKLAQGDSGSLASEPGGRIWINHDCNDTYREGIACVTSNNDTQYVGSLDNTEGYFALIGEENVIVGVKKP
jgi:hypothetical protein